MDGPLRLADYLADPWLRTRTGQPHLGRDPVAECIAVRRYLDQQPPAWRDLLRGHAEALPPLPPDHRLVVFLLAGNEAELIDRCLDAIAADLVWSGMRHAAEVVVVRQHLVGMPRDETADLVRDWVLRHRKWATVHLVEVEWPAGCTAFLPLSRKLAVDMVAQRAVDSGRAAPLYLITEDADVEWIERGRSRHVVGIGHGPWAADLGDAGNPRRRGFRALHVDDGLDAIRGQFRWAARARRIDRRHRPLWCGAVGV
jgi:hypothetical protein